MLNNIWNGLVNVVENTKRCFNELEAASTTTNEHLNDGLSAVLKSMDKLEIKGCSLQAMYDDMQILLELAILASHVICSYDCGNFCSSI